ncbi:MAG: ribonuclease HII [Chloroflexi bacterium]|nr:ribonuclease HII [Chloroflexota bacterium]MBI3733021.1 ribonuclease HII [Chloroflexota bacterium]
MPNFHAESRFHRLGLSRVAGLDEVGRGAWAGPLMAGAVILPEPTRALRRALQSVNDSKQLRPTARETCAAIIREQAVACAVGLVSANELDALGMTAATRLAMSRALATLCAQPQALLIDAFPLPASPLPQRAIVRGDGWSFSIAAASVIAKVARDALMRGLHEQYPHYHFHANKGYGTAAHHDALQRYGPSAEHRRSFAPVARLAGQPEGAP